MFALKNELVNLVKKDVLATPAEKQRVIAAIEGRMHGCVRFSDAADRLAVSKATIYALVKKGDLIGITMTGKRPCGVTEESLVAFEQKHQVLRGASCQGKY